MRVGRTADRSGKAGLAATQLGDDEQSEADSQQTEGDRGDGTDAVRVGGHRVVWL